MTHYFAAIACEEYADRSIEAIPFAERNARELARVLEPLGFDAEDQIVLAAGGATKTAVESKLRRLLANAEPNDVVFLYYVGRRFSINGPNFLSCADTERDDLEATSVPLAWLFERIKKSECGNVVLFLDGLHHSETIDSSPRGTVDPHADDELPQLADMLESLALFVACRGDETSYASGALKLGLWAHHLIEAFVGRAPAALKSQRYLTVGGLNSYLLDATPRTLAKTFAQSKKQTPWRCGGRADDFVLADLQDVLARRDAADAGNASQILKAVISREYTASIKTLAGFIKGGKLPDRHSSYAESLVAKLAADDLQADLNAKHAALKREFKFRRVDLDVTGPTEGAGTIITPFFTYNVSVAQDPEDATRVVWRRSITDVKDAQRVLSREFSVVFEKDFDTIELSLPKRIHLEDLIDRVEALGDERIQLRYDPNPKWVGFSVKGIEGELVVDGCTLSFSRGRPALPNELAATLLKLQQMLGDEQPESKLGLEGKKK